MLNVDEAGVVSLDYETDPPEVGGQLQAILLDPDIVTGAVAWSWWRDDSAAIAGATGDTYTATAEDAGKRLRAMASYADGHGAGKTAYGPLAGPVAQAVTCPGAGTATADAGPGRVGHGLVDLARGGCGQEQGEITAAATRPGFAAARVQECVW